MTRLTNLLAKCYKLWRLKYKFPNLLCSSREFLLRNNVIDKGHGNSIIIEGENHMENCNISFYGTNCILHIGQDVSIKKCDFWFEDDRGGIFIGKGTTTETGCQFASCEGKLVVIGNDCMLSHDIDIRNTDSHSIVNESGERINPSADIIIGDHVWIGIRSTILKGATIPSNSVVAAQSMVTASLKAEVNSLIAGSPAKTIKTRINWDRRRL